MRIKRGFLETLLLVNWKQNQMLNQNQLFPACSLTQLRKRWKFYPSPQSCLEAAFLFSKVVPFSFDRVDNSLLHFLLHPFYHDFFQLHFLGRGSDIRFQTKFIPFLFMKTNFSALSFWGLRYTPWSNHYLWRQRSTSYVTLLTAREGAIISPLGWAATTSALLVSTFFANRCSFVHFCDKACCQAVS